MNCWWIDNELFLWYGWPTNANCESFTRREQDLNQLRGSDNHYTKAPEFSMSTALKVSMISSPDIIDVLLTSTLITM